MPIPKPKLKEDKSEFLNRCMADPTMRIEYKQNDQRYAVCVSAWKRK